MMRRNSIVNELICDIRKFSVYRTANKLISLRETLKSSYFWIKKFLASNYVNDEVGVKWLKI